MENEQATKTVATLVLEDSRWAAIFERYGIDYCCRGKQTLQQSCEQRGLKVEQLIKDFHSIALLPAGNLLHVAHWDLPFLVEFLLQNHHRFTRAVLDELHQLFPLVVARHQEQIPALVSLHQIVQRIQRELRTHLEREEQYLFPFVLQGQFEQIPENVIAALQTEHELEGAEMERIRSLTRNFQPPAVQCAKTHRLYELLRQLYFDLHQHAFLENYVLFPQLVQRIHKAE